MAKHFGTLMEFGAAISTLGTISNKAGVSADPAGPLGTESCDSKCPGRLARDPFLSNLLSGSSFYDLSDSVTHLMRR